jgi:hypothetical protein
MRIYGKKPRRFLDLVYIMYKFLFNTVSCCFHYNGSNYGLGGLLGTMGSLRCDNSFLQRWIVAKTSTYNSFNSRVPNLNGLECNLINCHYPLRRKSGWNRLLIFNLISAWFRTIFGLHPWKRKRKQLNVVHWYRALCEHDTYGHNK